MFGVQQLLRRAQFFYDRLGDVDPDTVRPGLPEKTGLRPGLGLGIEDVPDAPFARPGVPSVEVSGQTASAGAMAASASEIETIAMRVFRASGQYSTIAFRSA